MSGESNLEEYSVTTFSIPKMDCPSEERMIRMAVESTAGLKRLDFDLDKRELIAIHRGNPASLLEKLTPLKLGAQLLHTRTMTEVEEALMTAEEPRTEDESKVLKILLSINGAMFVIEIVLGWIAQSTGLIADSLDMFADAAVYALSFFAVGKNITIKQKAALLSGYLQLLLAVGALTEVVRRFLLGSEPEGELMMGVALLALIANVSCLFLLMKHRKGEVHMRASWIFSTNDVIANLGVIIAGVFVAILKSPIPDLVIGLIISIIVLTGAIRILRLAKGGT